MAAFQWTCVWVQATALATQRCTSTRATIRTTSLFVTRSSTEAGAARSVVAHRSTSTRDSSLSACCLSRTTSSKFVNIRLLRDKLLLLHTRLQSMRDWEGSLIGDTFERIYMYMSDFDGDWLANPCNWFSDFILQTTFCLGKKHRRNNRRDRGRLVPQLLGCGGPTHCWSLPTSWPWFSKSKKFYSK